MKKTYKNLIGVALSSVLCLSLAVPANAQRGGEHSDTKSTGGGGSTPPQQQSAPQPQIQRSSPPPQQQAAPQQQAPRSYQAPQQQQAQPQMQRGSQQNQAPQQQQSGSFDRGRTNNAAGSTQTFQPRGGEHQTQPVFRPANPDGSRRYPGITQRGNSNSYNPRGGNYNQGRSSGFSYRRGTGSYRSYPGLQFGHNYITARPRGFYYRNRGYYSTYYTPQLGFSLRVLPYGYYPFYFGADQYFYNDGLYYRQMENEEYTVVEPPIGAAIDKLPAKAQPISINGMQYYELNGVYYQPITKDDGSLAYQIAGKDGELTTADNGSAADDLPQVGDLVDNLPEGCKIIKLGGQKYYVSQEGYYFQDAVDTNGDKVFKIVGTPTDGPNN